MEIAMATWLRV